MAAIMGFHSIVPVRKNYPKLYDLCERMSELEWQVKAQYGRAGFDLCVRCQNGHASTDLITRYSASIDDCNAAVGTNNLGVFSFISYYLAARWNLRVKGNPEPSDVEVMNELRRTWRG